MLVADESIDVGRVRENAMRGVGCVVPHIDGVGLSGAFILAGETMTSACTSLLVFMLKW